MASKAVSFRAMGTSCRIEVVTSRGGDAESLLREATQMVEDAEGRWSRFIPESDVSRINAAAGAGVVVARETCALVASADGGFVGTAGRFSPFVGVNMAEAGYGQSRALTDGGFDHGVRSAGSSSTSVLAAPAASPSLVMSPITIDRIHSVITLDPGVALDLGGIAKGYTADLVLAFLRSAGASSACVDLGGDLAVWSGDGHPWEVDVVDPTDPNRSIASAAFAAGGVATTSTLRRAWLGEDGTPRHHVIDPRTGTSASGVTVAVTVAADCAANAEILTKDLLLLPPDDAVARAESFGLDVVIVTSGKSGVMTRCVGAFALNQKSGASPSEALVTIGPVQ